jgi:glycerol uptake facilitator-like aquaporin
LLRLSKLTQKRDFKHEESVMPSVKVQTEAKMTLARRLAAEGLGTLSLLTTVIGSGIMAERLADGNLALALLGNTIPTGAILVVLITVFGPISGAQFNPAVTLCFWLRDEMKRQEALFYICAQIVGGILGVFAAHMMFDHPLIDPSTTTRSGLGQWIGEFIATFGLIGTILICVTLRPAALAMSVGLYITAAYWFTSSTSFANPAVTIARGFSDSFAGIAPSDIPAFIAAQLIAAVLATLFCLAVGRVRDANQPVTKQTSPRLYAIHISVSALTGFNPS